MWKGPQLYHENARITADYLCISARDIRRYSQEILRGSLRDTLQIRGYTIQSLTAEGDDRPEQ